MSRNACDYLSVKITTVYDPFTRRVFAANGESGSMTVIDSAKNEILATVIVGGKLKCMVVDGKGMLYVNGRGPERLGRR